MCGICGIINHNSEPVNESSLLTMMATMKHRGPDDQGTFIDGKTGLGFVRLSIIDLSPAGHQPMFSVDGRYVVVFNGEIYNYIELREELKTKGYTFHTQTDTEVLLAAYTEWGEACMHRFNGMWAFAIYDKETRNLFVGRDRFGVKPFYYYSDKDHFIFASEIPPILKVLNRKVKPDNQTIFDYLVFNRTDQTEATFFQEIKKLQHGHSLTIKGSQLSINKWYDLRSNLKEPFKSPAEYREMFSSAVGLRLRSDVPVGVCFSGGLDSSAVVSTLLSDDHKNTELNTFSAVYRTDQIADESRFIKEYESILKNMHYITPSGETLLTDMHDFIKAHAEPIPGTSPYAQFKVMELAKSNVVVTLDGQGADEQFAGYHDFFGYFFKDLLLNRKLITLLKEVFYYLKTHKSFNSIYIFIFFLLPKKIKTKVRTKSISYLNNQFVTNYEKNNNIAGNLYGSKTLNDALLNHFEYKLEHLLKWEDRNSMWFSLESRVPFLDYRLVERTLSLPSHEIIKNGMTKHFLRESMKVYVPEKNRMRTDKIGFATPQAEWFRSVQFKTLTMDLLKSEIFRSREIIKPEEAIKLFQRHLNGKIDISKEIWKWINLELWYREFID
ncbi:MAG: asparagine synthase (glutamine-hydrolyzing) [Bacteroidetes bacterium]|nr:asparagine synthase (glutamine-hydrolyzing) [Bacteroidota bacterium]